MLFLLVCLCVYVSGDSSFDQPSPCHYVSPGLAGIQLFGSHYNLTLMSIFNLIKEKNEGTGRVSDHSRGNRSVTSAICSVQPVPSSRPVHPVRKANSRNSIQPHTGEKSQFVSAKDDKLKAPHTVRCSAL